MRSRVATARGARASAADAVLLGRQAFRQIGIALARCALVTMLLRGSSSVGAEDRQIGLDPVAAFAPRGGVEAVPPAPDRLTSRLQHSAATRRPFAWRGSVRPSRFARRSRSTLSSGVDAERARQLGDRRVDAAGARRSMPSISSRLRDRLAITSVKVWSAAAVIAIASARPSGAVRLGGRFEQHVQRSRSISSRSARVLQHLEARRDVRLERKLMQQPRAEGVDGLHLQPARRLQRLRKQPARVRAPRGVGPAAPISAISLVERGVVERDPFGERVEHAVRHVGGRGLGEGEAEDLRRRRAASSSRITRCASTWVLPEPALADDPGRHAPDRTPRAGVEHVGGDAARSFQPSSSSPPADHSLTRARWS